MGSEIRKSKKLTFEDEPRAETDEVTPKTEVGTAPADEVPKAEPEPAVPKQEPIEFTKATESEPAHTVTRNDPVPVSQPIKTVEDIKKEYSKMSEKQYNGTFVQPDGPVIPEKFDLREEIAKLLVVNTDEDQVRTLVQFTGMDVNYYLLEIHPKRVYDAWRLYAEHEGAVPGKFMELVFDILKVQSRRYFHKVSTVELR